jgi:hypothetical protein
MHRFKAMTLMERHRGRCDGLSVDLDCIHRYRWLASSFGRRGCSEPVHAFRSLGSGLLSRTVGFATIPNRAKSLVKVSGYTVNV